MIARRRLLESFSVSMVLVSGCTSITGDQYSINQLEVELTNPTENAQVFHLVLEATDGLGEWHKYELASNTRETVIIEPEQNREYVTLHGFVKDRHLTVDFYGLSGESCPVVLFSAEFDAHVENEPLLALTTRVEC